MSDFLCPVFAVPVVCRIWRPFLSSILSDKLPSIRTRASAICVTRKRKCGPTDTPSTLDAQSAYMSIPATLGYIFVFLILCSSWPLKAQAPAQSSSSTIVGIEPYGSYTNNLDAINLAELRGSIRVGVYATEGLRHNYLTVLALCANGPCSGAT